MFFYTSGGGCFLLNLKKKKKHPHPTHTPPDMYRKDVFLLIKKHRKSLEISQGEIYYNIHIEITVYSKNI